ncbi:hypothetical protein niasHT_012965 [Heterodera trifolii]|uniref:Uncharacterized protein n=1 Tax=Heterodera trifolii TaxID=157864 RepID=A0ABD2L3D1_9BILA
MFLKNRPYIGAAGDNVRHIFAFGAFNSTTRTTSGSDKKHSIVADDGLGPALAKSAKVAICLLGMAGTAVHGTDCIRPAPTSAPAKPHSDETVPLIHHASDQTHSQLQHPPMVSPRRVVVVAEVLVAEAQRADGERALLRAQRIVLCLCTIISITPPAEQTRKIR